VNAYDRDPDTDERDMGAHVGPCRRTIYPWSEDDSARYEPCSCPLCVESDVPTASDGDD
jgi:hypothetical protein